MLYRGMYSCGLVFNLWKMTLIMKMFYGRSYCVWFWRGPLTGRCVTLVGQSYTATLQKNTNYRCKVLVSSLNIEFTFFHLTRCKPSLLSHQYNIYRFCVTLLKNTKFVTTFVVSRAGRQHWIYKTLENVDVLPRGTDEEASKTKHIDLF